MDTIDEILNRQEQITERLIKEYPLTKEETDEAYRRSDELIDIYGVSGNPVRNTLKRAYHDIIAITDIINEKYGQKLEAKKCMSDNRYITILAEGKDTGF